MTDSQPDPTPQPGVPQDGASAGSTPPPPAPGYGQQPPPPPAPGYAQQPPPPPGYGQQPPPGVQPGAPQQPLNPNEERQWAMFGHLGGIILGFISPLIVWLVFRERSAFVNDQGREGLNFQLTVLIGYVAAWVIAAVTLGALSFLPFLVWIASIVFSILAGVAANKGEQYRYPVTLRLIS